MFIHDTSFNKGLHVKFPLEYGQHEPRLFSASKPLILRTSCRLEFKSLILILQLDSHLLTFSFNVETLVVEVHKNECLIFGVQRVLVNSVLEFQTLQLINENVNATRICHKEVVGFFRTLTWRIKLLEQRLGRLNHLHIMGGFFWRFALIIPRVKLAKTRPDHKIDSYGFSRSKSEMERVVADAITRKHLVFEVLLILLENELSLANLQLGPIWQKALEMLIKRVPVNVDRFVMFANKGSHKGRSALIDANKGTHFEFLEN